MWAYTLWAQIGSAARARAEELALQQALQGKGFELSSFLQKLIWIEVILIVLLSIRIVQIIVRYTGYDLFRRWDRDKVNMRLWIALGLAGIFAAVWGALHYMDAYLPESASAHGKHIDRLRNFMVGFTFPALISADMEILQWALPRRCLSRNPSWVRERAALIAISIPVFVIAAWGIHIRSLPIHGQSAKPEQRTLQIEVVAEQFQWRVRYPRPDGKLGRYHYKLIGGENVLGLDFTDLKAQEDILPTLKEIHLPVGALVTIYVCSKDVLHSLYLPHFRTHIYAVSGQRNQVMLVPAITTKEMRKNSAILTLTTSWLAISSAAVHIVTCA